MELLSKRTEAVIDRLTQFADGDKGLVTTAIAKFNSGEIDDLVGYIDKRRPRRERPATPQAASGATVEKPPTSKNN
jgi:hypothetical protein